MSIEYAIILKDHGFTSITDDMHHTIAAYDHEINGVLFDDNSPFIAETSETLRQPSNFNCLISCTLPLKPGASMYEATGYLINMWYRWLRQKSPVLENIETMRYNGGIRVRVLTISKHTACSIEFIIINNN